MKLLIIDNNIDLDSWGAEDIRRNIEPLAGMPADMTVYLRRAPHNDLPSEPTLFDFIIISGSKTSALDDAPWVSDLEDFIRRAIDAKKRLLGICYGHQVIARALGGKRCVRVAPVAEFGWVMVETLKPSDIFNGLPKTFYTFSSHFDEVAVLPKGMECLARSEHCQIQAFQLEGFPVFGIQFHPERNIDEANSLFDEIKKTGTPKLLLNPDKGASLYDPKVRETIFRNFLTL
ncbi:MAG: type 1 glutamine amidotransferase [Bdellovibrionota bacterium]